MYLKNNKKINSGSGAKWRNLSTREDPAKEANRLSLLIPPLQRCRESSNDAQFNG